jgi:beta-mannosidase
VRKSLSLNGQWTLRFYPEQGGELPNTPEELNALGLNPINATVPGNVELDLIAAGIAEDPYFGLNSLAYRKYEFYSWWFERDFTVPAGYEGKDIILRFDGLDTFARVFINGQAAGGSDNMLIPHEFDVTALCKPGETVSVAVHISSAVNKARAEYYPAGVRTWEALTDEYAAVRKPAHSFGWDISARLLSAGIWRDVTLYARGKTYIREVYYSVPHIGALNVFYRFQTDDPFLEGFSVRVEGVCGESTFTAEAPAIFVSNKLQIHIPNPRLWWPSGYGEPDLYSVTFSLLRCGETVDTREENIGIRTVKLERAYGGEENGNFRFIINGVPVMAMGTNWVHLDCLHSRDKARLPAAHQMLRDLNCNMIRMWGGNVYECDEFYDLCDRHGIMVWQDFSLACALYSQYEDFAAVIDKEASSVILRLRNHPSIVLWAGDNELDVMYASLGHAYPHGRYNRVTRETLPRALMMHDPYREYLPSSPLIEGDYPNDSEMPEQHNYGPRDYYKGDFHRLCKAHFISEISYHGCPAESSLRRFIPEDELWPFSEDSKSWRMHNTEYIAGIKREYDRNVLMFKQVKVLFGGIPEKLQDFIAASQISQAEALKFLIENTRAQKWRKTGMLWWNLADGWPQLSDAAVDYYDRKKLAFHYVKRAQQPLHIIIGESSGWKHTVCLCNDTNRRRQAVYKITDHEAGRVVSQGEASAGAGENLLLPPLDSLPGEHKLYLIEWESDGERFGNHYINGFPPFGLERYKGWLEAISRLPGVFDAGGCFK